MTPTASRTAKAAEATPTANSNPMTIQFIAILPGNSLYPAVRAPPWPSISSEPDNYPAQTAEEAEDRQRRQDGDAEADAGGFGGVKGRSAMPH
jgi:hypothetical protein